MRPTHVYPGLQGLPHGGAGMPPLMAWSLNDIFGTLTAPESHGCQDLISFPVETVQVEFLALAGAPFR